MRRETEPVDDIDFETGGLDRGKRVAVGAASACYCSPGRSKSILYHRDYTIARTHVLVKREVPARFEHARELRERGLLIDASFGRSTRSVLSMDSGNVILSALPPETIAARCAEKQQEGGLTDEG